MTTANTHNKCFVLDNFILYIFLLFVPFHGIFSRQMGRGQVNLTLSIWLNENVGILPSFSRHGRIKASFILLIWLNENVFLMCLAHHLTGFAILPNNGQSAVVGRYATTLHIVIVHAGIGRHLSLMNACSLFGEFASAISRLGQ